MKKLLLQVLTIVLLSIALVACGPSQAELDATATQAAADTFGTQTAQAPTATPTFTPSPTATATNTPTPTFTATPTNTPTITPTPTPQWMGAGLVLGDMPTGFREMTEKEIGPLKQNLPDNSISFGFTNTSGTQIVMGYLISYPSQAEQLAFDGMLPDMLKLFASAYGATTTPESIPGLDGLGVSRAASMFVAERGGVALRWENILFRRGEIGAFLFVVCPDGEKPAVPGADLAYLLDGRIDQKLTSQALETSRWIDDFNAGLLEPWEWVNENPNRWSLTEQPGYLRIYLSPYAFPQENALLRPGVQGDFTLKTHLIFKPDTNYQFAGLVIFQDAKNHLAFGRAFCNNPNDCVGNGIYFDYARGAGLISDNFATSVDSTIEAYLRLERRGKMIKGFYSSDGITWLAIGEHEIPSDFQVNSVGLIASNDLDTSDPEIPADFDYFELIEEVE